MTTSNTKKSKPQKSVCAPFSKMSNEEIDELLKKCTNVYPTSKCKEIKVPLLGMADCTK
ncbi:MAG: hypothetical protein IJD91_01125 [Clostridia bacterium]|nr:hypothetical protein [Clostridia bacterium]